MSQCSYWEPCWGLLWFVIPEKMKGGWLKKQRAECNAYLMWWTLKFTPNPTRVYFWVQISIWQPPKRLHPKQHWESDISSILVSIPCVVKIGVSLWQGITEHPWEKIHRLLCYQIFDKDGKHLMGIVIILGAQTSVWGDSKAVFPRASGIWHSIF